MKRKNWIAFGTAMIAAFALAPVSSSAATGTDGSLLKPTSKSVTITVSAWGQPTQFPYYHAEAKAFERLHPNVTVNLQLLPWNQNQTKLTAELAGNQLPDVMGTSGSWFSLFASKGAYLNLTPYFKASRLKAGDFAAGGIAGNSISGKLFMIPNGGANPGAATGVVLYNKNMLAKAHLAPPPPNWTLRDFVHYSQLLTLDSSGKNATQKGFNPSKEVQWGSAEGDMTYELQWDAILSDFGGWYWNSNRTASTIASPAAVKTLKWFKDLVSPWNASMSAGQSSGISDPFAAGKVAFRINYSTSTLNEASVANFPIGIATVPSGPAGRPFFKTPPRMASVANGWTISANSKHPRTAWEYIKFLATSPVAMKAGGITLMGQLTYAPLKRHWLSTLPPLGRELANIDALQWKRAPVRANPYFGGEYSEFWNDLSNDVQKFYLGQATAVTTLKQLQHQANALLKQYGSAY